MTFQCVTLQTSQVTIGPVVSGRIRTVALVIVDLYLPCGKIQKKQKTKKKRMIESFRIPEIQGDFLNIIKTVSTGPA